VRPSFGESYSHAAHGVCITWEISDGTTHICTT